MYTASYCQVILLHIPEKSIATLGTVPVLSQPRRCNFPRPIHHVQAANISNKKHACLTNFGNTIIKRVFDKQNWSFKIVS